MTDDEPNETPPTEVPFGAAKDVFRDVDPFEEELRVLLEKHGVTFLAAAWLVGSGGSKGLHGVTLSRYPEVDPYQQSIQREVYNAVKRGLVRAGTIKL